jgi:hypothetical protein
LWAQHPALADDEDSSAALSEIGLNDYNDILTPREARLTTGSTGSGLRQQAIVRPSAAQVSAARPS